MYTNKTAIIGVIEGFKIGDIVKVNICTHNSLYSYDCYICTNKLAGASGVISKYLDDDDLMGDVGILFLNGTIYYVFEDEISKID